MKNVTYGITEEKYSLGSESRISYGIAAYSDVEDKGTTTIICSIHDITHDKARLSKLVDNCNRLELSTIHLSDVVEDFLTG